MSHRPMPGPPEHDRYAQPHMRFADEVCALCMALGWSLQWEKRLTDAECAAEYWRALRDDEWDDYVMDDGYGPPNIDPWGKEWWSRSGIANEDRLNTWRRFATTPHALENGEAAS